ncbi:MAG: DUF4974 domain-containing protein [Flavobacteriaceae bacterium]|nr:DUF4974 domain-containing protein [Flavobacteriaceae bacterium]
MEKDYLLQKWLNNDLTEAERKAFKALDDYDENLEILEASRYFKADEHSEIPDYASMKTKMNTQTPVRKLNWTRTLVRVAAIVAITLGVYYNFFYTQLTQVQTLAAEKTTIELPDASTVVLNALSEISYSKKEWDESRELNLDGEAYFKVAKGKVFDVITDEGVVTVVGTEFNVKRRGNYFEVACFEGIVKVSYDTGEKQLIAGEVIRIVNGDVGYKNIKTTSPQWTQNISYFDSVPYSEVISELERQYAIKVNYKPESANLLFTGGFVHDSLDKALNSITQPLKMTYTMDSSNLVSLKKRE